MARQRGRTWAVWGSVAQGCQVAWELSGRAPGKQAPGHLILELIAYRKPPMLKLQALDIPPHHPVSDSNGILFKSHDYRRRSFMIRSSA